MYVGGSASADLMPQETGAGTTLLGRMRPTSGLANHPRGSQRRLAATDRLRETIGVSEQAAYESNPATDRLRDALARLDETDREVLTLA